MIINIPSKGWEKSYKFDYGIPTKMRYVLYVPGLKKNLLSISTLDKKGFRVDFVYGEVLMWTKGKTIDDAVVIRVEEGGLYKLKGHTDSSLMMITVIPCELWHIRHDHIHYKEFPIVSKVVRGLSYIHVYHKEVCIRKEHEEPFSKKWQ